MPGSNTPVTNVAGADVRCNVGGTRGVAGKCAVKAGASVTIEIHQVNIVAGFSCPQSRGRNSPLTSSKSNPVTGSVEPRLLEVHITGPSWHT